ncbi:MAG: hypothetical protein K2X86_19020 [Cytophagaceae bacterium]|nr:hypothetical protein [Cytophagaceae bacterium]
MKRYIVKVILFCFPFLGLVAFVNIYYDPGEVFHSQNREASVLMIQGKNVLKTAIPNDWTDFHLSYIQERLRMKLPKHSTVLWGSSRSSEITKELTGRKDFHNFALPGSSILDHVAMINIFEELGVLPDTIILNIDPWMFYGRKTILKEGESFYILDKDQKLQCKKGLQPYFLKAIKNMGIKPNNFFLIKEENNAWSKFTAVLSPSYFQSSVKALNKKNNSPTTRSFTPGFFTIRSDGSYSLGTWEKKNIPRVRISSRIYASLWGENFFYEASLKSEYFKLLERFTAYLQNKKTTVYYFLAPVHPLIYPSQDINYQTKMEKEIKKLSAKYHVKVLGAFNPYVYPELIEKEYFIDSYHLSSEGMNIIMKSPWQ